MRRRAFFQRMAFAALACGFFDRLPLVLGTDPHAGHDYVSDFGLIRVSNDSDHFYVSNEQGRTVQWARFEVADLWGPAVRVP